MKAGTNYCLFSNNQLNNDDLNISNDMENDKKSDIEENSKKNLFDSDQVVNMKKTHENKNLNKNQIDFLNDQNKNDLIKFQDKNSYEIEMLSSPESDYDPVEALDWNNGIGNLPGTNFNFKLNEYDELELLSDKETEELKKNLCKNENINNRTNFADFNSNGLRNFQDKISFNNEDALYSICSACGVRKPKSSFIRKGKFCSQRCATFQSSQLRNFKKTNSLDILTKPCDMNSAVLLKNKFRDLKKRLINCNLTEDYHVRNFYLNEEEIEDVQTKVKENFEQDKIFSWKKYLIKTRSVAAPIKCFKPNQLYGEWKNFFKPNMKLEAIDPLHPSLFCVATVLEISGFRLRIHLDKYSNQFDFWVNADSPFIFPIGWCAKTNRKLQFPKNYESFDWNTYLQQEKSRPAPKQCFFWYSKEIENASGFEVGMKLEAVDKANSSLVCVATINDIIGDWLLIHFDGWDDSYDYWADVNSPHIHPINWCKSKGKSLTPPKDYHKSSDKFSWQEYLEETNSVSVASNLFRTRSVNLFKQSMKLEVVDKKNPRCIRVATIISRNSYSIKINFDNWDEKYDFWIDDDSPDIHPVNWCYKTNHYLEEPPTYDYDLLSFYNRCPIFGCKGVGHVSNLNLLEHESAEDCPYSEENMEYEIPDRFGDASDLSSDNFSNEEDLNFMSNLPSPNSDSISTIDKNFFLKKKVKNLNSNNSLDCSEVYNSDSERMSRSSSLNSDLNMLPIKQSMFDIKTSLHQVKEAPSFWEKNSKNLNSYLNNLNPEEVLSWSSQKVADFVSNLHGCSEFGQKFKQEFIDGEAFLLLTQTDLVKILGIKLGPAVKIYNCILVIRRNIIVRD